MRLIRLKVKEALQLKGMTQKALAKLTGLRENAISNMCRTTQTSYNLEHLSKVAEALGISDIKQLMDFVDEVK